LAKGLENYRSRWREKHPHSLPLSPRKKRSGRGERSKLFQEKIRKLPSPGALFARGEGQGVRVLFAPFRTIIINKIRTKPANCQLPLSWDKIQTLYLRV